MNLRRALHVAGAGALTGALLLGVAPTASADDIRDRQWALRAFSADEVWQKSTGEGVTVAVIDTGVDSSHPDLQGKVLKGKDFTSTGDGREDPEGHGTSMASLIAGQGHGSGGESGVKGLAPESKILPVRTAKEGETQGEDKLAEAIRYAVDHDAQVINVSQGSAYRDAEEEAAVKYALKNDVMVVASSGNEGVKKKTYPAAYPGVVSVGGVDEELQIWHKSAWGSNVTLMAPATNNVVADSNYERGYAMANGTSDATAYVSASAALIRAKYPDLSAGQVINRLVETALVPEGESKKNLPAEKYGYGMVRPNRALAEDVPAGPKAGPLASQPDEQSGAAGAEEPPTASDDKATGSDEDSGTGVLVPVGIGLLVVVALAVLVTVLVKANRKKNVETAAAGGPGAGWGPGQPPYPGQQVQPPPGQFGGPAGPPPPPNQPPGQ